VDVSRGYRKYLSVQTSAFEPIEWGGVRIREDRCIYDELRSLENGEVIFPPYYGSRKGSRHCSSRLYYPMKNIRTVYFTGLRNILNGYTGRRRPRMIQDFREDFLAGFNNTRKTRGGFHVSFAWLDTKEAKEMIKAWKGDPLDILYELARKGVIEKAARLEGKKMLRK
jgi:hypothetical protein